MQRIRKSIVAVALMAAGVSGTGAVADAAARPPAPVTIEAPAHVNGTWHYDGQYVGTQWCVFLVSPTGHSTLIYCYDALGASKARIQ